jgi:fucose 4-O-acetylase-like acetyltransferase
MQWFVLLALLLLAAARFFDSIPYTYYHPYDYWNTSPNLVANKTAVVLLLFAACYGWTNLSDQSRFSWVRQLGHTSLLIYWVHIEIVYGRLFQGFQRRLTVGQTVLGVLCLWGAMLLLSVAKTRWIERRKSAMPAPTPPGAPVPRSA